MKFIRGALIFAFAIGILLNSIAFATSTPAQSIRQPSADLSTADGRMRFAFALLRRHPGMLQENMRFQRGLMDALKPVLQIQSQLGDQAEPLWLSSVTRARTSYFSGAVTYDKKQLESVIAQLTQDLERIGLDQLQDINTDLAKVRAQSVQKIEARNGKAARESFDEKLFRKSAMRLLRLAPLIYGGDGKALPTRPSSNDFTKLTPSDLDNAYNDTWKLHLRDLVKKPDQLTDAILIAFEREFVNREIVRATLARSSSGTEVARAISIEEVPAAVGIYRGCLGGDCSILSVPYYPLIEGTSVFVIRKSNDFDAKPDGYAFIVKIRIGEDVIPYVVTINGVTLTEGDAAAVLSLVARVHGTKEVLVPDFKLVGGVVNTTAVTRGMTASESQAVDVPLPKKWSIPAQHRDQRYTDYYRAEALRHSRRARTTSFPVQNIQTIEVQKIANPYVLPENLSSIAKLDRALLAVELLADQGADQNEILSSLRITRDDVEAARPLTLGKPISAKTYQRLEEVFDYLPKQLITFTPANRLETLFILKKTKKFRRDSVIDQMILSAFKQMEGEITSLAENSDSRAESTLKKYFDLRENAPSGFQSIPMDLVQLAIRLYTDKKTVLPTIMLRHEFLEKQSGYPLTAWFENEINVGTGQRLIEAAKFLFSLPDDHPSRAKFFPLLEKRFLKSAADPGDFDPSVLTTWAIDYGSKNKTFLKKFIEARLSGFEKASTPGLKDNPRFIRAVAESTLRSDPRLANYLSATLPSLAYDAFSASESVALLVKLKKSKVPAIALAAAETLNSALHSFRLKPSQYISWNPDALEQALALAPELKAQTEFLNQISQMFNGRSFAHSVKIAETLAEAKVFILPVFQTLFSEALNEAGEKEKALVLLESMLDASAGAYAALFEILYKEGRAWGNYKKPSVVLAESLLINGFRRNPAKALSVIRALQSRSSLSFAFKLMQQSGAKFPSETLSAVKEFVAKQFEMGDRLYFEDREALVAASLLLLTQTGERELTRKALAEANRIDADTKKVIRDLAEKLPELEREQLIEDIGFYRPEVLLSIKSHLQDHETKEFMEDLVVRYYSTHRSEIPELLKALTETINRDPGSGVLWTNLEVLARIQPMPMEVKRFLRSKLKATQPQYITYELNKQAAHALLLSGETTLEVLSFLQRWGFPKWYDPQNPTAHIPKPYAPKMSQTRNRCESVFAPTK